MPEASHLPLTQSNSNFPAPNGRCFVGNGWNLRILQERRWRILFGNRQLWFVTPEDLILLKLLANRPRDHGDIADVQFVQGQLDEDYMRQWADALKITDRLTTALNSNE